MLSTKTLLSFQKRKHIFNIICDRIPLGRTRVTSKLSFYHIYIHRCRSHLPLNPIISHVHLIPCFLGHNSLRVKLLNSKIIKTNNIKPSVMHDFGQIVIQVLLKAINVFFCLCIFIEFFNTAKLLISKN